MTDRRSLLRPFRPVHFFSEHVEDTTARTETLNVVKFPKGLGCTLILTVVILLAVLPVYAEANGKCLNL